MTAPVLTAEGVGFRVEGATLVDGVSLEVFGEEILGVVGPNGAGKTSLLRVLAGEVPPSTGRVLLGGVPLASLRPLDLARRRAQALFDGGTHGADAVPPAVVEDDWLVAGQGEVLAQ
jgi:iron complex transport system ATP-binding protein